MAAKSTWLQIRIDPELKKEFMDALADPEIGETATDNVTEYITKWLNTYKRRKAKEKTPVR